MSSFSISLALDIYEVINKKFCINKISSTTQSYIAWIHRQTGSRSAFHSPTLSSNSGSKPPNVVTMPRFHFPHRSFAAIFYDSHQCVLCFLMPIHSNDAFIIQLTHSANFSSLSVIIFMIASLLLLPPQCCFLVSASVFLWHLPSS